MQEVGFQLYTDMLAAAVRSLKAGREPDLPRRLASPPRSTCTRRRCCPADYCGDVHERLVLYKRLANCETPEELDAMLEEIIDRFGQLPDPAQALLDATGCACRQAARRVKIDAGPESILLQFIPSPPLDPAKIIRLVQSRKNFKLSGQDRLRVEAAMPDVAARVTQARAVLKELG